MLDIHFYYTYGNESAVRPECIDEVNRLAEQAEKNALTCYHPAYIRWQQRYNLLSAAETALVKVPKIPSDLYPERD